MLQSAKASSMIKFLITYYSVIVLWWLFLFFTGSVNNLNNYLFAFCFGLIPLFGGIFGIVNFNKWGFFKSFIGKGLLFISLGLATWGIGQVIFSYYNLFLNVEVPYPSLADASFILSWPLWGVGVFYLSKATGMKFGLRSKIGQSTFLIIPLITIALSYYFLVIIARDGVLADSGGYFKLFFDLAYPIGDVVILTMVALVYILSFNYLGGKFKVAINLILIGFVINYIADFSFSYSTTVETFFSANWVDLVFATAMFTLSLGVTMLNPRIANSVENIHGNHS